MNGSIDFGNSFLTDADIDKSVSKDEYVDVISSKVGDILKVVFSNNYVKQQVKVYRDRINFACPYCMDSMQSAYKKRGNIILEGKHRGFFKCHNCNEFKSVENFLKDFKVSVDLGIINYIGDNKGDFITHGSKYDMSILLDISRIEQYALDRELMKSKFGLVEVKGSSIWGWLTRRMQYDESKFLYNPTKKYLLVLNNSPSGKIMGCQKRTFSGVNKYITFNASKLYELLGMGAVPDDINTLSQIFGITNLDFRKPVTVFEGAMDSFFFKNSVAMSGANKAFPLDMRVRYWFDYDKTGLANTVEYINNGDTVFLWGKLANDISLPYRKKWDLNDLILYLKLNKMTTPFFDNYFSSSPLDIIDI